MNLQVNIPLSVRDKPKMDFQSKEFFSESNDPIKKSKIFNNFNPQIKNYLNKYSSEGDFYSAPKSISSQEEDAYSMNKFGKNPHHATTKQSIFEKIINKSSF